jgi:hypothetical protein
MNHVQKVISRFSKFSRSGLALSFSIGAALLTLTASPAFAFRPPNGVIIEHVTNVGFAPPAARGTFKFQVLESGLIQKIDNKGLVTVIGSLMPETLYQIVKAAASITTIQLVEPDAQVPRCMDAPSESITINKLGGNSLTLWERFSCLETFTTDNTADLLVKFMRNLKSAFAQVN